MTGADEPKIDPLEALAPYGIEDARAQALPGGMVNLSFRVDAREGAFVLKWYRPGLRESQPERLAFVCETQREMLRAGMPVPAIVPDLQGNLFAETEAGHFVLSEFVEGRQFPRGRMPRACARTMGAELHKLFEALAPVAPGERRRLIPPVEEARARIERLVRLIATKPFKDIVDRAALAIFEHRRRGLEAWTGPVPDGGDQQCIHGDFQDSNLIFGEGDDVRAIIDWDNLTLASRAFELMRAFNYSFPDGAQGGMDFLEGYVRTARPSPEEASDYVDLWSYIDLQRIWPIDVRYEQPELYQARWDEFIRPPTGWWEANKERVRQALVRFSEGAASDNGPNG